MTTILTRGIEAPSLKGNNRTEMTYPTSMHALEETSGPPFTDSGSEHWIFDRLKEWSRSNPNRRAFIVDHADSVEEYTYADVLRWSEGVAGGLERMGIRE